MFHICFISDLAQKMFLLRWLPPLSRLHQPQRWTWQWHLLPRLLRKEFRSQGLWVRSGCWSSDHGLSYTISTQRSAFEKSQGLAKSSPAFLFQNPRIQPTLHPCILKNTHWNLLFNFLSLKFSRAMTTIICINLYRLIMPRYFYNY